jgi:hypothetical protein
MFKYVIAKSLLHNRTLLTNNLKSRFYYISQFTFLTKTLNITNALFKLQKAGMRSVKSKRKLQAPDTKYKMKTKNSLKKRMRIVNYY